MNDKEKLALLYRSDYEEDQAEFDSIGCNVNVNMFFTSSELLELKISALAISLNMDDKYKAVEALLGGKGWTRLSAGTNRLVFKSDMYPDIVIKIAMDDVATKDGPMEFVNQSYLKPYVTKIFDVSENGVVTIAERIVPMLSEKEYCDNRDSIYKSVTSTLMGRYMVEDIGSKFFMNWGFRINKTGRRVPILLDFPYIYRTVEDKMYCAKHSDRTDIDRCSGRIDYDIGFNILRCDTCGKQFFARDLGEDLRDMIGNIEYISKKGGRSMKIQLVKNGEVIKETISGTNTVVNRGVTYKVAESNITSKLVRPGEKDYPKKKNKYKHHNPEEEVYKPQIVTKLERAEVKTYSKPEHEEPKYIPQSKPSKSTTDDSELIIDNLTKTNKDDTLDRLIEESNVEPYKSEDDIRMISPTIEETMKQYTPEQISNYLGYISSLNQQEKDSEIEEVDPIEEKYSYLIPDDEEYKPFKPSKSKKSIIDKY